MKKMIFICQSKGGVGKSVLTFLLAEKYKKAIIVDMDDAAKSSMKQLAYRKPVRVSFLSSNASIDRGLLNSFYEKISTLKADMYICDFGASVSEQLPYYFQDMNGMLTGVLTELGINLEIYCVVAGGNIFPSTMEYLEELNNSVKDDLTVTVLKNGYYHFSEEQDSQLKLYAQQHQMKIFDFNISRDQNESTQSRIREVLQSGEGIEKAKLFSKIYFQKAINNLQV